MNLGIFVNRIEIELKIEIEIEIGPEKRLIKIQ